MNWLNSAALETLMEAALAQAQSASNCGEVPVGAVIARSGEIVAQAHNLVESMHDPSAHAEVLAIRRASAALGDWRLTDCVLCVTLEPCTMCIGAIKLARIPVLVFGAKDENLGAVGSIYDLSGDDGTCRVISGIHSARCAKVLSDFFERCRNKELKSL